MTPEREKMLAEEAENYREEGYGELSRDEFAALRRRQAEDPSLALTQRERDALTDYVNQTKYGPEGTGGLSLEAHQAMLGLFKKGILELDTRKGSKKGKDGD